MSGMDPRFQPDGRSNRQRMLAGHQYIAEDAELAREGNRAARLTAQFNAAVGDDYATRAAILREVVPAHELTTTVRDLVARVNATKSDAPAHRALADAKAECDLWRKVRDDALSYAVARAGA